MSRAIPSSFSEYLLDSTSVDTGIICNGGIMPLRNDPSKTSISYRKCLRGEDVMFLQEAICARRTESNYGLSDRAIRSNRLSSVQTKIGYTMSSNLWTDSDPTSSIGVHGFGATSPTNQALLSWVQGKLHPISQSSAYDTYQVLDAAPIERLFDDVGKLNYKILFDTTTSGGGYYGWSLSYIGTLTADTTTGHTDGSTTHSTSTSTGSFVWYDADRENYTNDGRYPNGLRLSETTTISNQSITISEYGGRTTHRYFAIKPFFLLNLQNYYYAEWNAQNASSVTDSFDDREYVFLPAPVNAYVDMLNPTTITYNTASSIDSFLASAFSETSLQRHAADIQGQYNPSAYHHERQRRASVSIDRILYLGHFLYCNLEGVV
jgi:hypothetical protein